MKSRASGVVAVEIQRFAPFGVVARAEVVRAEALQVVAVRPEMVVDDIENYREPDRVRAVDEALERIGVAIHVIRREELHAVIAPVPAAGTLCDRHHLDHRDAELAQVAQLPDRCVERTLGRERADVQLVDDLPGQLHAAPLRIVPLERRRIDEQRRSVHALRLEPRARIGPRPSAVDAILI
jgi:hypothetical protein